MAPAGERSGPGEWLAAIAWVGLGTAVILGTARLATTTPFGPGPRFAPLAVSVPLLALGFVRLLMLGAQRRREAGAAGRVSRAEAIRLVALAGALFAYAAVLETLGFFPSTALLCWVALVVLGRGVLRAAIESAAVAALVGFAFTRLLGVQLPAGEWELLRSLSH